MTNRITFTQQRRLVSENPRIVEYRFSDRPDEVFTNLDDLKKHRGLTMEQLRQTVQILPAAPNESSPQ
jgi:hypothetical protein